MPTVTISNINCKRTFGWAFSTTPTGRSTQIAAPTTPEYVGTLSQVRAAIGADRAYQSFRSGGTYISSAWFYGGKKIVGMLDGGDRVSFAEAIRNGELDADNPLRPTSITLILQDEE